jgi:MFS family permease
MAMGNLLRDGNFWFLAFSLGLLFSAYSAVLANINPYVTGAGFSSQQASSAIMLLAFSGLVGKLLFGMMADRIDLKVGLWLAQGLALAGCALLAIQPGYAVIMLAATVLGLAAGGMLPVWGALVAQLFGRASYGRAMGGMGPIITLSVLPGYTVTGILFDRTGDYSLSLWIFCAVIAASAVLLSLIKLPAPAHAEQAAAA